LRVNYRELAISLGACAAFVALVWVVRSAGVRAG
jgi:hypothetical protein